MALRMIFGTLGGLGLFLYGMMQMSGGLKKAAGKRLKNVLESMTRNRIFGCGIGAGTTALIQSSSATTVMVVGFVNAGLLTLRQAISVIIGSNVGTTATAWLVSVSGLKTFEVTDYALPAVAIGFGLHVLGRRQTAKNVGQILIGFGILFLGIWFMKNAFSPLKDNSQMHTALVWFGRNPFFAVLAGMGITMLLQSSSASVALIQILAMQGAFGNNYNQVLTVVIPFILGDNIGTTITAQLASLQANRNARRAAWAHTLFNLIGAFICFWFINQTSDLVKMITPWELRDTTIGSSIAVTHTTIKVFEAAFFLPLVGMLETLVVKLVPERPGDLFSRPTTLERHLLQTPELALDQVRREIVRMARTSKRAVNQAVEGLVEDNWRKLETARMTEDVTDHLQYEITSYVAALSAKELSDEMSMELPVLLHTVNDLERIGDHAVNIVEIAERKIEQKLSFSESAHDEIAQLKKEAAEMCDYIIAALEKHDVEAAKSALTNENNLNRMQLEFRRSHVQRMTEGLCSPEAGLIFCDLVDNVEKIGDHLTNIAQAVIGGLRWDGVEPRIAPVPQ